MAYQASADDAWTTVRRSKGNRPSHTRTPKVNGQDKEITAEDLQKDFHKKRKLWQASSCRKALIQILEKSRPDEGRKITKAICLATGSFSTQNFEMNKRSVLQLACFIDSAAAIEEESGEKIEMLAQEPSYNQVDEEFLSGLSITVLPLAAGVNPFDIGLGPSRAHMGPKTLTCNFFMNISLTAVEEFFGIKHGLYIGTPFNHTWQAPVPEFVKAKKEFHQEYVMKKMLRFEEDPGVFEGLVVYWPEPREGDDDG